MAKSHPRSLSDRVRTRRHQEKVIFFLHYLFSHAVPSLSRSIWHPLALRYITSTMNRSSAARWAILFGFFLTTTFAQAESYDLIIRHGRVVDGSGNPAFFGDVAIKDG